MQEDSEYKKLFNYNLQKLYDAGILDYLAQKYMTSKGSLATIKEAVPLGYDNVIFPSLLLFTGILASLLIVCFEKISIYTGIFTSLLMFCCENIRRLIANLRKKCGRKCLEKGIVKSTKPLPIKHISESRV